MSSADAERRRDDSAPDGVARVDPYLSSRGCLKQPAISIVVSTTEMHLPLTRYVTSIRLHPAVVTLLLATFCAIVGRSLVTHTFTRSVAYLLVIAASVLIVDVVAELPSSRTERTGMKSPSRELVVGSLSFMLALAWLTLRFVVMWQPRAPIARLLLVGLGLGSLFNVFVAVLLVVERTSPEAFGIRLRGLRFLLVGILFMVVATCVFPSNVTWHQLWHEAPSVGSLVLTVISAAVPEEFFRFFWQTRASAVTRNAASSWLLASSLWALLHVPRAFADSHSWSAAIFSAINIVPLGLLWGYITRRAESFVPAAILHGTNVWGLQNLG